MATLLRRPSGLGIGVDTTLLLERGMRLGEEAVGLHSAELKGFSSMVLMVLR